MGNLSTNDPLLYERLLLDELSQIAENRGIDSDVMLLWAVLEAVEAYFDSQAVTRDDAIFSEINDKFSSLARSLAEAQLGKKLETDSRTKAMGLLVEGLIHFGMPRKPAIQAVSKKLNVSETSVRVGNELFRELYGRSEDAKRFDAHIVISVHRSLIENWLEDRNYPAEHPKSKQAFQKLYALLKGGITER